MRTREKNRAQARTRARIPGFRARFAGTFLAACTLAIAPACSKDEKPQGAPDSSAKKKQRSTPPLDRLANGEIAPGDTVVWGFTVPRGMRLEAQFRDAAHIGGKVPFDLLTEYVGKQIAPQHAELTRDRALFPHARITGGSPERIYDIEVRRRRLRTKIVIRDITPPPPLEGLTEAERWKRLGLTPEGEPLSRKELR